MSLPSRRASQMTSPSPVGPNGRRVKLWIDALQSEKSRPATSVPERTRRTSPSTSAMGKQPVIQRVRVSTSA